MGSQLRFSMYFFWQFGLMLSVDEYAITISLPFIQIFIAITKDAEGYEIFTWHHKDK